MRKFNKTMKLTLLGIIIILIIGAVGYSKISSKNKTQILSSTIEENISKLVELSTIKYNYSNIVEYKNNKELSGMKIPFTLKTFLVKYSGYIKAGINLDTIEIKIKDKDSIEIIMEKPKIFENVISEEDVYFYNEKDSIFNKLNYKDLYDVLIDEKEKMEAEVIEKGILNEAQVNGSQIIRSLLEGLGFKDIIIKYK